MDFPVLILQCFHVFHVFYHHQGDLKGNRVFKHSQVQSRAFLEFVQPVYQSISVNIKLSGGFGNIQAVFKELVDSYQSLFVKIIRRLVLKDFLNEHLAQRYRKLI